ncbi:MAG TPA: hypothetical protein VMH83_08785, partial [Candidatus Acidoferrum sp.]|nr:hypothetical protein [Candidatus Acidoferrum sp.]
ERQDRLALHLQHRPRYEVGGLTFSGPDSAKVIGNELKELSEQGLVIALAGNAHSMKTLPEGWSMTLQEGQYAGPRFTHIFVTAAEGGTAWNCTPACSAHDLQPSTIKAGPDTLVDGKPVGHDWIYFVASPKFTASPPMEISSAINP